MRNRQEFEERVYELYRIKKQKRAAAMKRFTTVGVSLVAVASVVLLFTFFNRDIKRVPETNKENGMAPDKGSATENIAEEVATEMTPTTWDKDNQLDIMPTENVTMPENDMVDAEYEIIEGIVQDIIVAVIRYPANEKYGLDTDTGKMLMEILQERGEGYADEPAGENNGSFYEFVVASENGDYTIIYNNGCKKIEDDWIKMQDEDCEALEKILEGVVNDD